MTTRAAPVQASCACRACDILGQRAARGAPGSANVPPPRRRGPQVRAPWHHGGHRAVDVVGPVALPGRTSGRGDKECTQIGENGLSAPFWGICVHYCGCVGCRVRFSVRWLDVCPGEEKRILRKSALWLRPSRKDALCVTARAQNALFREVQRAECAFPSHRRHRVHFSVRARLPKDGLVCQANIRTFHIKLSQSSNTAMISSPSISPVSVKRNELYK